MDPKVNSFLQWYKTLVTVYIISHYQILLYLLYPSLFNSATVKAHPQCLTVPVFVPWDFTNRRTSLVRNTARMSSLCWPFTSALRIGSPCRNVWLALERPCQKKIANDQTAFSIPTQKVSTGGRISFTPHSVRQESQRTKTPSFEDICRSIQIWTLAVTINLK